MDLLSELFMELRLESTLYCRFEALSPWAVEYPQHTDAFFHVVMEGRCELHFGGEDRPVLLEQGDFVVLPRGRGHVLRAGPNATPVPVMEAAAQCEGTGGAIRVGGNGEVTRYLCGAFHFGTRRDHPLLKALPEMIHVRSEAGRMQPWLETHLASIACEASSNRPGAGIVVARLSDVLFLHAVRAYLAQMPETAVGSLRALQDPQIARAVMLIHRQPERRWSVESLAREAMMSRSHFAARFAELVGEPPLTYLTAWRMYRAQELLRQTPMRLNRIAAALGYGSEAAFSTAFRRWTGVAPGAYRRGDAPGVLMELNNLKIASDPAVSTA